MVRGTVSSSLAKPLGEPQPGWLPHWPSPRGPGQQLHHGCGSRAVVYSERKQTHGALLGFLCEDRRVSPCFQQSAEPHSCAGSQCCFGSGSRKGAAQDWCDQLTCTHFQTPGGTLAVMVAGVLPSGVCVWCQGRPSACWISRPFRDCPASDFSEELGLGPFPLSPDDACPAKCCFLLSPLPSSLSGGFLSLQFAADSRPLQL